MKLKEAVLVFDKHTVIGELERWEDTISKQKHVIVLGTNCSSNMEGSNNLVIKIEEVVPRWRTQVTGALELMRKYRGNSM